MFEIYFFIVIVGVFVYIRVGLGIKYYVSSFYCIMLIYLYFIFIF